MADPIDGIVIVTGSRVFADKPESRSTTTARAMLEDWLRRLPEKTLVISGGAPGPDRWASEIMVAIGRGKFAREYTLSGNVQLPSGRVIRSWVPEAPTTDISDRKRWPLYRNEIMVNESKTFADENGLHLELFGIGATWSVTQGTADTISKCGRKGIPVVEVWFSFSE